VSADSARSDCCGLPVGTFRPITGHGRDDTEAIALLGLTTSSSTSGVCSSVLDLLSTDSRSRRERVRRGKALLTGDAADAVERVARGREPSVQGRRPASLARRRSGTAQE